MGARILKKIKKFPLHPSFLILFLWFIVAKDIFSFVLFISVVLSHEYGHYVIAKKLGYKLDSFFLAPYGACLNYKEKAFEFKDEIKIALAGPLVNILLCFVTMSLWWVLPEIYNYTHTFVSQSFMLAIFNLLPCYPLDGGRVFVGLVSLFKSRKTAIKIIQICNIVVSVLLLVSFIITCFVDFNPTFCLCGCFLLFGVFESKNESKYQPAFLYKKKTKNYSKPFLICLNGNVALVDALKRIESNRFTIFVVILSNGSTRFIDEQKLKNLILKFPTTSSFDEILIRSKLE